MFMDHNKGQEVHMRRDGKGMMEGHVWCHKKNQKGQVHE